MKALIVDGGGTQTRAWLVESDSREVLRRIVAGPANISHVGKAGLRDVFAQVRSELSGDEPVQAVFGLAGVGRSTEEESATEAACEIFPKTKICITTDAQLAYSGAFAHGRHGILILAGTGSIAFYQSPSSHEFFRAGGWGPLLGDEGSGAWLGREALRHCLWEWETEELTPFHEALLERIGVETSDEILTKVYSGDFGPARWGSLAPLVFRFAREDRGALRILRKATMHLISLAERLMEDIPQSSATIPLVIMGGLWEQRELLEPLLKDEIEVRNLPLVITDPDGDALDGGFALLKTI